MSFNNIDFNKYKDEFVKKSPDPLNFKLVQLSWNLFYPIKQIYFILSGKAPRLRSFLLLLIFPLSWPFNFIRSLFILFGKHSYVLLGVISLFLLLSGIQSNTYVNIWFGSTGGVLAVALFIRFIASKYNLWMPDVINKLSISKSFAPLMSVFNVAVP